jgi:hypothetical protein
VAEVVSEFEARRVERMLRELYLGKLKRGETLQVSGTQEGDWLCVRWELASADRTFVYPVEAKVDLRRQKLRVPQAVDLLYDLLGAEFDEHLRGDRSPFTGPEWEAVDFEGREVFLRGQIRNDLAENAGRSLLDVDALARSRALAAAEAGPAADTDADRDPPGP